MSWKTARSSRWSICPVRAFSGGEILTAGFYHYKLRNEETNDTCWIALYGIGAGLSVVPAAYSENLVYKYKKLRAKRSTSFDDLNLRRARLFTGSIQTVGGQNASGFILDILDGYSAAAPLLMRYKSLSGTMDFGFEESIGSPTAGFDVHACVVHVKWEEVELGMPDIEEPTQPSYGGYTVIPYSDPVNPPPGGKKKIRLDADVLFGFDKHNLRPEAKKKLGLLAYELSSRSRPNVTIEGHADSKGSAGYNRTLSLRRANSVKDWFVRNGVPGASSFLVTGKGEGEPIADNSTTAGRAKNRRVEISIN